MNVDAETPPQLLGFLVFLMTDRTKLGEFRNGRESDSEDPFFKTKLPPTIATKHSDSYLWFLFSQKLKSGSKGQPELRRSEPLAWLLPSVGTAPSTPRVTPVPSPTSFISRRSRLVPSLVPVGPT